MQGGNSWGGVGRAQETSVVCPTEGVPCLRNTGGRFEFCEVILANDFFTTAPLQGDYVDLAFTRVPQVPG